MSMPELLTQSEAAGILRVTERSVRNLLSRGELAHIKVGSARRITRADLQAYIHRQRVDADPRVGISSRGRRSQKPVDQLRQRLKGK